MALYVKLFFASAALISAAFSNETTKNATDYAVLGEQMKLLGVSEGKAFFAFYGVNMDWFKADQECRRVNMKLAEVTSMAQWNVIKANSNGISCCAYWVGGRDAIEPRQFSWNSNNANVATNGFPLHKNFNTPVTCLIMNVQKPELGNGQCTSAHPRRLCEAPASILNI